MRNKNSILTIKEYGKVHIHLRELLKQQDMTRSQLAQSIHTRFEVVNRWYQDDVERIDADILARICFVLSCDVQDIICYERPDHPPAPHA